MIYIILVGCFVMILSMALVLIFLAVRAELKNPTPKASNSARRFRDIKNLSIHQIYHYKVK